MTELQCETKGCSNPQRAAKLCVACYSREWRKSQGYESPYRLRYLNRPTTRAGRAALAEYRRSVEEAQDEVYGKVYEVESERTRR